MNKEAFFALPAKDAVKLAYINLKSGKITYDKFDDILRAWWRNQNFDKQNDVQTLDDVVSYTEELFNQ